MKGTKHWVTGGLLIALGVVLLSNNLGYTNISVGWIIRMFWPLLLVYWGTTFLWRPKKTGEVITGLILVGVGIVILGNKHDWFAVDLSMLWKLFWPTVLILAGISFLTGSRGSGKSNTAFMSAIEKRKTPWKLEDSTYWAVMGGIELDLNMAEMEKGATYTLSCNAVMGGIEIRVPRNVTVYCNGTVILGGLEMLGEETGGIYSSLEAQQIMEDPEAPVIHIHNRAVMGGVEIQ